MPRRHARRERIARRHSLSVRTGNDAVPRLAKVRATRLAIADGLEGDERAVQATIERLGRALGLDRTGTPLVPFAVLPPPQLGGQRTKADPGPLFGLVPIDEENTPA